MTNYHTKLTYTPAGLSVSFGQELHHPSQPFQWSYIFSDGSCLVGKFNAKLDEDENSLLSPTQIVASYLSADGQTVLLSWQEENFPVFEVTCDGSELLLMASNDGFVTNSMCIDAGKPCPRSQVTHWGLQLCKEKFNHDAWSLTPVNSTPAEKGMVVDWGFSGLFPFWQVSWNFSPPFSKINYQWTFDPYLPFFALIKVSYK